jgi:anti-sigma28 factor (negative regulator of flagellin synthesis)
MSECKFQEQHIERIVMLETEVNNLKDKIDCLDSINISITRLTTLLETQVEENKRRDETREKENKTLERLSVASIQTAQTLERLNEKIDLNDKKIENLDKKISNSINNWKVDISSWIPKIILALCGSGLIYFVLNADKFVK